MCEWFEVVVRVVGGIRSLAKEIGTRHVLHVITQPQLDHMQRQQNLLLSSTLEDARNYLSWVTSTMLHPEIRFVVPFAISRNILQNESVHVVLTDCGLNQLLEMLGRGM